MKNQFDYIILLVKRLILVYAVFFICRLLFYIFNHNQIEDIGFLPIIQSFAAGLIFDTSAIVYLFSPFMLLHLLPLPFRHKGWFQIVLKGYFLLMLFATALFNLIDIGYFPFTGRRSGIEIFSISNDISDQTFSYIFTYWYLFIILCLILFGAYRIYPKSKLEYKQYTISSFLIEIFVFVFSVGVGVLGARGGTALKPITTVDAASFADVKLISLTLNTPFQILITSQYNDLEEKSYLNKEEALQYFNPVKMPDSNTVERRNIVLIVMESMGKEYVGFYNKGKGYTPFLDSLGGVSKVYMHAYANGKRSIEGIPAIIASMPTSMGSDYINTRFQTNRLRGIGGYLGEIGYDISFYHGCKNGTMRFDNFVAVTGSGAYFGLDEYPNKDDFDGHWGIYDEPYLQYFVNALDAKSQPFFSTVFTLSSHHPYPIPKNVKQLFPEGSLPIHRSIRYADYALKQFFKSASSKPWFKNTIFILTADHSAENETPYYQNLQGKYEIPFLIFDPQLPHGSLDTTTFQQADILPLILNRVYPKQYFAFSNFDKPNKQFAVQFLNGYYQLIQWPWVYHFDGNIGIALYNLRNDSGMQVNLLNNIQFSTQKNALDKLIKSYIQQYNDALIHNKSYVD